MKALSLAILAVIGVSRMSAQNAGVAASSVNVAACRVNDMYIVGSSCYQTIAAAASAAGSNGCISSQRVMAAATPFPHAQAGISAPWTIVMARPPSTTT